ncbi:DMT family transporter [Streptomyces sp. NPDC047071]|uniref:DMT family transporter n=1 Tax=Streptomyces sp. NPDC047071 TaxID=3154808 RepID=UPI00345389E3
MSATLLAVALSLVSAVAYATAAVAQERLAARLTDSGPRVLRLLGSGAWWASVGLNASAALLHVAALKYGPLTLVQPLGALTLVAAVPLGAHLAGRRVTRLEWRGTGLTLIGLGALLLTASGPAPDDTLTLPEAVTVAAVTAAVIGMLSRRGARPGLRHATASGFASGVASALTQTVTVAATDTSGPLFSARVVVVALLVAAFAVGGLFLSQTAYRGGLGAPLAVVTLANPVAASAIGVALLGERLRGGAGGVVLAAAGAALAAYGVVLLTRSPRSPAPVAGSLPSIPGQPEPAEALSAEALSVRRG